MRPEAYSAAAQAEENHWWFAARREVLAAVLERLYVRAANPSVLEVGCGNGGNLAMLARYGALYATEVEDQARARATSRGIAVVENGWLPDGLPFAGALFDLVAALDVLEHVADDAAALAALGQRLKPDGLLFLTVPAYPWLWSAHDEFSQHKRRYTLGGMRSLVERCGLRVTYASYFNCLLFPFGAVKIGLGNRIGANPEEALRPPAAPINGLLRFIFGMERYLLPRVSLPFGMSIVVCAQRIK